MSAILSSQLSSQETFDETALLDGETRTQAYARLMRVASEPAAHGASPVGPSVSAAPKEQTFTIDDEKEGIRSYLAEGEVIEGNLRLKNGIRIAGEITGRVHCESGAVIVERTAVVGGGIEANDKIIVDGQVGQESAIESSDPVIRTPGLLAVMGTGRVYGSYHYGRIATYDDATLEGMGRKIRG